MKILYTQYTNAKSVEAKRFFVDQSRLITMQIFRNRFGCRSASPAQQIGMRKFGTTVKPEDGKKQTVKLFLNRILGF